MLIRASKLSTELALFVCDAVVDLYMTWNTPYAFLIISSLPRCINHSGRQRKIPTARSAFNCAQSTLNAGVIAFFVPKRQAFKFLYIVLI